MLLVMVTVTAEEIGGILEAMPKHGSNDDSVLAAAEDVTPLYKNILTGEHRNQSSKGFKRPIEIFEGIENVINAMPVNNSDDNSVLAVAKHEVIIFGEIQATSECSSDDDSLLAVAEYEKPLYRDILTGELTIDHLGAVPKTPPKL